MSPPQTAVELLREGETALLIFTRDTESLRVEEESLCSSRSWVVDPNRHPNRVIVYHRHRTGSIPTNEVIVGDFVEFVPSIEHPGRHIVRFRETCRTTSGQNWRGFAQTWSNPVRFISSNSR